MKPIKIRLYFQGCKSLAQYNRRQKLATIEKIRQLYPEIGDLSREDANQRVSVGGYLSLVLIPIATGSYRKL